jgi:hypothetical protein
MRAAPGDVPEEEAATEPQEGHGVRRSGLTGHSVEQEVCAAAQRRPLGIVYLRSTGRIIESSARASRAGEKKQRRVALTGRESLWMHA